MRVDYNGPMEEKDGQMVINDATRIKETLPTLENGGAAQYEVCMDVPAAALPGQRVLVEETFGITGRTEASWCGPNRRTRPSIWC